MSDNRIPPPPPTGAGLYDPRNDHDACGIGFVVDIKNRPSHSILQQGLEILNNLNHRGAVGADPLAGDGAGLLLQLPDTLLRTESDRLGLALPPPGDYAVGMVFLPRDRTTLARCEAAFAQITEAEGQTLLGWREVPTDNTCLGNSVKPTEPLVRQVFLGRGAATPAGAGFERKLFVIRKQVHHAIWDRPELADTARFYIASLSSRTLVYKGMMLAPNLPVYYRDLQDPRLDSALALVHQRFSTNTFPSWRLAQPFRYLCHNGEINTLRGNVNWMQARRHTMKSAVLGADLDKLWPLIGDGSSDSAIFDNALELLVAGGYPLVHAMMLMIPEAWADNPLMDEPRRAFYEYHAALMEPWDGPAAVAFTDGLRIGATLDRNGLRPARYLVTADDRVILASEAGVLDIPQDRIVKQWRLQPGKMFLIDLAQGRIVDDAEIKAKLAAARPYREWLRKTQIQLTDLPAEIGPMPPDPKTLLDRQQAFGYTQEDLKFFLGPMALSGQEPVGAMGRDIPQAVLSQRPKLLFDYFKQNFAQVTNPPIDSIREELVMSLVSLIGPRPNLLELHSGGSHKRLEVRQPVLANVNLERIRRIENHVDHIFRTYTLPIVYPASSRRRRHGQSPGGPLPQGHRSGARRLQHPDPVRPRRGRRPHPHSQPARHRRRAPSPDPRGPAHLGRIGGGDRRSAAVARLLRPGRLWRRGDQPLSRLRHSLPAGPDLKRTPDRSRSAPALHQGGQQGHPQGHGQDGHLDLSVLLRRPDLRRHRPGHPLRRPLLQRHQIPGRGGEPERDRRGERPPPSGGLRRSLDLSRRPRRWRRTGLAQSRRRSRLDPGDHRLIAARGPRRRLRYI